MRNATLARFENLFALVQKEWLQVFRDPSALLVAFVLPLVMLFIFGYGLSLDAENVKVAVALEDRSPVARSFWIALNASRYFQPYFCDSRAIAEQTVVDGRARAAFIVPADFTKSLENGVAPKVQLITDGSEANTAVIIESYASGVYAKFLSNQAFERGITAPLVKINVETQMRYNVSRITRNSLTPGSIVLILAMIGSLLTAMVVAREWERGTMEAVLSTSVGKFELILGKLIPYFILGILAAVFCAFVSKFVFKIPFRGSAFAYLLASGVFLLAATAQGLLISTICKSQTVSAQIALLASFLPNFIFSGVLFELDAMPAPIRALTYLFPARYFTVCIQTIFMAGDVWPLLLRQIAAIATVAVVLLVAVIRATKTRLE